MKLFLVMLRVFLIGLSGFVLGFLLFDKTHVHSDTLIILWSMNLAINSITAIMIEV